MIQIVSMVPSGSYIATHVMVLCLKDLTTQSTSSLFLDCWNLKRKQKYHNQNSNISCNETNTRGSLIQMYQEPKQDKEKKNRFVFSKNILLIFFSFF